MLCHFFLQFTVLNSFVGIKVAFQKSYILLYTPLVNLVSIQPSLWSTKNSFFFLYQFVFISHMFFLFVSRFLRVLAFHQNFHVFSIHVFCYFFLLTRMCTCEETTSARRVICSLAWSVYMRGKVRQPAQAIYRLPNISPFQNDLSIRRYIAFFI